MRRTRRWMVWTACLASGFLMGAATVRPLRAEPLPDCEYCGAPDSPPASELSWSAVIARPEEPGERMIVSGVVYEPDGRTPAPGVLVYLWHTDATGIYPRSSDQRGNARRHGRLRAWLITDADGRYQIETIKPAPYPNESLAAHIHATLTREGQSERWIEDFLFEGDPFISEREALASKEAGRFGPVLTMARDEDGVLRAERDIRWPARGTR